MSDLNVLCALKNSKVNLCWWYKNKKMFKFSMGLARALKASLNAPVLAASIIVSGSSFHSCPINVSLPSVLRCVIIMECPTWVWDNICSTHYWPQRTKQVEQQSQGKVQLKNDGLLLFTTSQMSSFIATICAILFINTFSINLEIASCPPRMITVFWRPFNLFSWGVHYAVFVMKGKLQVPLNNEEEEYEEKPTHNSSSS